jgi:hypothetical protein
VAAKKLLVRGEIDERVYLKLKQADRIYQDHYSKQTLRAPTRVPLQPLKEIGTGASFGLVKGFQTVFKDGNSPAAPAPSQVLVYSATTMHSSYGEQEEWRIRHLLDAKNVMYEIIYVDLNRAFKEQMIAVSGSAKLPQVHIDRRHYTFEELQDMEDRQELDIRLKHAHRRAGDEVGNMYHYEEKYKEREELRQHKAAASIANACKQFTQSKKDGDANPIFRKLRVLQKMKNVLKLELNNLQERGEEVEEDAKRWEEEERARWELRMTKEPAMPPSPVRSPLRSSPQHSHAEDAAPASPQLSFDHEATVLQRMYHKWRARRALTETAMSVYEKLYDPNSKRYYYYNVKTDMSSWRKPLSLGSKEPRLCS